MRASSYCLINVNWPMKAQTVINETTNREFIQSIDMDLFLQRLKQKIPSLKNYSFIHVPLGQRDVVPVANTQVRERQSAGHHMVSAQTEREF